MSREPSSKHHREGPTIVLRSNTCNKSSTFPGAYIDRLLRATVRSQTAYLGGRAGPVRSHGGPDSRLAGRGAPLAGSGVPRRPLAVLSAAPSACRTHSRRVTLRHTACIVSTDM